MDSTDTAQQQDAGLKYWLLFVIAVVLVGAFFLLVKDMLGRLGATDLEWTRAVYLLSGVEAIAFTAAGYLFGKEVHRREAENANERAEDAQEDAATSQQEATAAKEKGRALADAIAAKASAQPKRASGYEGFGPGAKQAQGQLQAELEELNDLAGRLFPSR